MAEFISKHKKPCIIVGIVLAVVLLAVYLRAMFLPGLWYGDAFMYKQDDGSFAGSDIYAEYKMNINPADYGTDIDFSVNNKTNHYQIKYDKNDPYRNVEVLENGTVICKGKALGAEGNYFVFDDESGSADEISIRVGNEAPTEEELYPGYTRLYNWSVNEDYDTRGNPGMLILIVLFALILFLDIKFPMLFWILEHRLEVDGGEPSDWYLFGQKVGRVVLSIGILVCVILTFTIH
ncbi:MAG: hypothetical protein J6D52_04535 [Clostridia bacterium]|nr:hypothetical protein [Clostridia bacterium]